jgi:Xaa-Pro aminopeptidase
MDYKGRLARARLALEQGHLDALLVTYLPNIAYLCGFTGSAGVLVIGQSQRDSVFFTDGRYTQQAHQEIQKKTVRIKILTGKSALAAASEWLAQQKSWRKIGIDATHLSVAERNTFAKSLRSKARLVEAPAIVEQMRMIKDPAEITKIRAACHLGVALFDRLLEVVRPGVSETQVAGELEFAARRLGAEQMSFSTIIAGGPRSALPHGRASQVRLPPRGFVVCDFGVILAGYCSDMTRTLHLGRPPKRARRVYEAVREAQQAALDAVKPGTTVGEVDRVARKLLHRLNLARFFTHSTGHGLGLEIHEAPRIAAGQGETLRPGMVITIEPGVYLPGELGVRIEDTVVVTDSRCEILTPCPKELIVL